MHQPNKATLIDLTHTYQQKVFYMHQLNKATLIDLTNTYQQKVFYMHQLNKATLIDLTNTYQQKVFYMHQPNKATLIDLTHTYQQKVFYMHQPNKATLIDLTHTYQQKVFYMHQPNKPSFYRPTAHIICLLVYLFFSIIAVLDLFSNTQKLRAEKRKSYRPSPGCRPPLIHRGGGGICDYIFLKVHSVCYLKTYVGLNLNKDNIVFQYG